MRRWLVLAAPALLLCVAPPACIGTESGNPSCVGPDCPVQLALDAAVDEVRAAVDGTAPDPWLRIYECPFGHDRGELHWSPEDVTMEPDGSVTIRVDVSAEATATVRVGGRHLDVTAGELTITADPRVSGTLTAVRTGVDAAITEPLTVTIEGELDVWCGADERGIELVTVDGRSLVLPCNTAWEPAPPCDDTGGGCS